MPGSWVRVPSLLFARRVRCGELVSGLRSRGRWQQLVEDRLLELPDALLVARVHHPAADPPRFDETEADEDLHLLIERRLGTAQMLEERLRRHAERTAVHGARPSNADGSFSARARVDASGSRALEDPASVALGRLRQVDRAQREP